MNLNTAVLFCILAISSVGSSARTNSEHTSDSMWQAWSGDIFDQATRENRFVILDLEAVWCHWCHVMEETTYANGKVIELLKSKYIPVRVDQDANPDLSNRYGDYGWPATIVFAPDGTEIVKMRGYIPPARMIGLLQAIIDDPSPGPSVVDELEIQPSTTAFLTDQQRAHLLDNYLFVYDNENGGWGSLHKFIHIESMDYALANALRGDTAASNMARQTLNAALALFDPVWGGVYQYSDKVDWSSPHYEKIMWYQTQYLRIYSEAYALWREPQYLQAAQSIYDYLINFMRSPEGVFYTSQDADLNSDLDGDIFYALNDSERRKLGLPRIDKKIYARENGWIISALTKFYAVFGAKQALDHAITCATWMLANRSLPDGGFAHGANDRAGPFLGDALAMGQALLDLYAITGDRYWLLKAHLTNSFINTHFKDHEGGGYFTSKTSEVDNAVNNPFTKPVKNIDENIQLTRFANLIHRYHGNVLHQQVAEHAMKYLSSETITAMRRFLIGVMTADDELANDPIHITVVGHRDNLDAHTLHRAALAYPGQYKRVDWWDKREGPLPNPDITYPQLKKAAAFACANNTCSLPVFESDALAEVIVNMMSITN